MNCGLDRTGDVVVDGAAAQNRLDIIPGQIVNLDHVLHPVLLSVIDGLTMELKDGVITRAEM